MNRLCSATPHQEWVLVAILILLVGACTTAPETLPTPPPVADASPPVNVAEVEACEALVEQLGALISAPADEKILEVAIHQGKTRAESCRAHFKSAAKSDEATRLADVFADLIHIRRYDLELGLRASRGQVDGVCQDSGATLARVEGVLKATQAALDGAELSPPGRDTFKLIKDQMVAEQNAIEPFYRRACKTGHFDPSLLTQVDDLPEKFADADACLDLVYAYTAFDFESADISQVEKLRTRLSEGAKACPALLNARQVPATLPEAKAIGFATVLESAPLGLDMALARAKGDMAGFCKPLKTHLQLYEARGKQLKAMITGTNLPPDVLAELLRQQDAALEAHKELASLEPMCSI